MWSMPSSTESLCNKRIYPVLSPNFGVRCNWTKRIRPPSRRSDRRCGVRAKSRKLRLHLTRRKLEPEDFALPALAAASNGFSGAEIEQAIVAALYTAHAERKPLDTDLLMQEIRGSRPLSVIMAEQVSALRAWASERTVPAD